MSKPRFYEFRFKRIVKMCERSGVNYTIGSKPRRIIIEFHNLIEDSK